MNLGAHISIANGMYLVFERAEKAGANSIQIFLTNQNQWNTNKPPQNEIELFFRKREEYKPFAIIAHSRYLINMGSIEQEKIEKSMTALQEELDLCEELEIKFLVLHPGSHKGIGEDEGLKLITQNLDSVIAKLPRLKTKILLETTAGQGSNLGYKFEQLAYILNNSNFSDNLAVCFDTCHAFTSGYNLIDEYDKTFEQFDRFIGLDKLLAFHLNDSKKEYASRLDRHEHIGKGYLGIDFFRRLMRDPRFLQIPMVLETPSGENNEMDAENLSLLRQLREDFI